MELKASDVKIYIKNIKSNNTIDKYSFYSRLDDIQLTGGVLNIFRYMGCCNLIFFLLLIGWGLFIRFYIDDLGDPFVQWTIANFIFHIIVGVVTSMACGVPNNFNPTNACVVFVIPLYLIMLIIWGIVLFFRDIIAYNHVEPITLSYFLLHMIIYSVVFVYALRSFCKFTRQRNANDRPIMDSVTHFMMNVYSNVIFRGTYAKLYYTEKCYNMSSLFNIMDQFVCRDVSQFSTRFVPIYTGVNNTMKRKR